jgi:hypothetical protein
MQTHDTLEHIILHGKKMCEANGHSFIDIYEVADLSKVEDGWDRFVVSKCHLPFSEYKYVGFVRVSGEFVGRAT